MNATQPNMWVGTRAIHREVLARRLADVVSSVRPLGLSMEVASADCGPFALFALNVTGRPPAAEAWGSILRCQVASALADVVLGPVTQRWLTRRVLREARRRGLFLPPTLRPRAVTLARQLVEPPPPDRPPPLALPDGVPGLRGRAGLPGQDAPGREPHPAAGGLCLDAGVRPGNTLNLSRWHGRVARCLLEALAIPAPGAAERENGPRAERVVLIVEGAVRFRLRDYEEALKRAARSAVAELAAEREEQRLFSPWRSLWLGPPPRLYEAHVFREPDGSYRLTDRWGMPAGARWAGESLASAPTEGVLVGQLLRLAPRRIVLHAPEDDPAQGALRGAFSGRVYSCRGCHRCGRSGRTLPRQPS